MLTQEETMIILKIKDRGEIKVELDEKAAPITAQNFTDLVSSGFYDGLTFHRVIEGFMIQGGCPSGTGTGGSGKNITGEFAINGHNNPLKHLRGVLSMARSMMPNSASSQFFIMHQDSPHLDGQYAAFGKVIEGMEIVDTIATSDTDRSDKPLTPVIIEKAWIAEE
jgi:peptidyl-prolyl cis-trans isomerase B (cyclophilin B)